MCESTTTSTPCTVNGQVEPSHIYQPDSLGLTGVRWPRTWVFVCGSCNKDATAFSWHGRPVCPYCRTTNVPVYTVVGY